MSNTKTVSVPHLNATVGYQYVFYESMFSILDQILSLETWTKSVYPVNIFPGSTDPLK